MLEDVVHDQTRSRRSRPRNPPSETDRQTLDLDASRRLTHSSGSRPLSNHPFPIKKGDSRDEHPCYATSVLFQERELEKYDDWNPKNLQDRRGKLVNWALERWAIPERYRGEPAAEVGDVVQDG